MYEYVAFCGVQIFRTTNTLNAGTNAFNCTEIATTYTMCYRLLFLNKIIKKIMSEKLNQKDITLEEMFEWLESKRHNAGIDEFEHLMIDAIQYYLGYTKDDEVIYSDVDTKEQDMYLQSLSYS